MELKITDWLAIYAAIVSTLVFCWNIKQSKAKIKVNILPGFDTIDGVPTSGYFIIVRNVSSQAIPIGAIGLLCKYEHRSLFQHLQHLFKFKRILRNAGWVHHTLSDYTINTNCPIKLEPRSSHKVIIEFDSLEKILKGYKLRLIKANVQDQLWNDYFSKSIKAIERSSTRA